MAQAVAVFVPLAAVVVAVASIIANRRRSDEMALRERLRGDFDDSHLRAHHEVRSGGWRYGDHDDSTDNTDPAYFYGEFAAFFQRIEHHRRGRKIRLAAIDAEFAEPFFLCVHSPTGVAHLLHDDRDSSDLLSLYADWITFRTRRQSPTPGANTLAARHWRASIRARNHRRGRDPARAGRIQWHRALHEQRGRAKLVFWRLRFPPKYNQQGILSFIGDTCIDLRIESSVVYELLGPHDLLLRCWCPAGVISDRDGDKMEKALLAYYHEGNVEVGRFDVSEVLQHWWWDRRRVKLRACRVDDEDVTAVYLNPATQRVCDLIDSYNDGETKLSRVMMDPTARRYLWKGYIRWRRLRNGIKFATLVEVAKTDDPSLSPHQIVSHIVRSAAPVGDRSLYRGGGFADYLVLGRVRPWHFDAIRTKIIEPIVGQPGTADPYRTTLTYVASGPGVMRRTYKDRIAYQSEADHA
jgi:hypothetical protein